MSDNNTTTGRTNLTDAKEAELARRRTQGHVVDCDGRRAVIMARVDKNVPYMENYWAVGQLVTIREGRNRVVGQTFHVESGENMWSEAGVNTLLIHLELVGEIQQRPNGEAVFSSGIANYPRMGATAHRIRGIDLEAIYKNEADTTITIGHLAQERAIPAKIDLDKLTSRHFAIVGSTGTGKSTSVSLMLHKIIDRRPDLRVLILDPHNEFSTAFVSQSVVRNANSLTLPFWLFTFDEFSEIVFRGQKGLDTEAELLRDAIAEAKHRFENAQGGAVLIRKGATGNGFTADSPVPYRLADLFKIIEEKLGQLEGKAIKPTLKSLKDRLISISEDPRFAFTFARANVGGDRMHEIVADLFRVPHGGRPISVVDMSELPSEVLNSVASVLCRMAFDLAVASQGGIQTLVVCEEAHRYIPANKEAGFWPTRQAVARIAKEGRKYGVYLGIVTQRPGELDPTILSQCNTVFAMRLSNQNDQRIIGDAMTNGAQTSINFISSLADRECIAFGEALKTPMRMIFETIPAECLPGAHIQEMQQAARLGREVDLGSVIRRMRETASKTNQAASETAAPNNTLPQREVHSNAPEDEAVEASVVDAPNMMTANRAEFAEQMADGDAEPAAKEKQPPEPAVKTVPQPDPEPEWVHPSVIPMLKANSQKYGKSEPRSAPEPLGAVPDWASNSRAGRQANTEDSSSGKKNNEPKQGSRLVSSFRSRQ